jgi:hypothetical protein
MFVVRGMTGVPASAIVVGVTPWGNTAVTPTLVSSAGARERGAVEEVFGSVRLAGRIVHVDDGRLRRGGPHEWRGRRGNPLMDPEYELNLRLVDASPLASGDATQHQR